MVCSQNCASNGPRYFGFTHTFAIVNRHTFNSQPLAGGFDHHFHRPAIGHLFHVQIVQDLRFNSAKRSDIGYICSVKEPQQQHDQAVSQAAVKRHGTFFQDAFKAAANHQIGPIVQDRAGDRVQLLRIIAAITVQKYDDIGPCSGLCSGQTG